jgi:hypothetical protein
MLALPGYLISFSSKPIVAQYHSCSNGIEFNDCFPAEKD